MSVARHTQTDLELMTQCVCVQACFPCSDPQQIRPMTRMQGSQHGREFLIKEVCLERVPWRVPLKGLQKSGV